MLNNFCNGCEFDKYPVCSIFNINTSQTLDSILYVCNLPVCQYLVCPKNAQSVHEKRVVINEKCNNCGFCEFLCKNSLDVITDFELFEKVIISDLSRLNIYCSRMLPNSTIVSEGKIAGNFRQKRIDLVIKTESRILLLKVLQNTDNFDYYFRSYEETANYCKEIYPEFFFDFGIILPQIKTAILPNTKREKVYSIKMIKELG